MRGISYDAVKRVVDVVGSMLLLLVTSPIQAVVAILVRRNLGSPILFRQPRPGKDEVTFELVKFRTMATPDPAQGMVTDGERLGRFGAALRATSLDELPTLWNVLKGDMSLVGPRPLLVHYLDRYSVTQSRRHEVRPGMTGLAQVTGRNSVPWDKRLELDVAYVDARSFTLDCRIALATLVTVISRTGVSGENSVTMPEFEGPRDDD